MTAGGRSTITRRTLLVGGSAAAGNKHKSWHPWFIGLTANIRRNPGGSRSTSGSRLTEVTTVLPTLVRSARGWPKRRFNILALSRK